VTNYLSTLFSLKKLSEAKQRVKKLSETYFDAFRLVSLIFIEIKVTNLLANLSTGVKMKSLIFKLDCHFKI